LAGGLTQPTGTLNVKPGVKDLVSWLPAFRIPAPSASLLEYQEGSLALADGSVDGRDEASGVALGCSVGVGLC
jgi:hypothetical protein